MKILEIAFSLSPGGAERFVVDLCNELSKTNNVTLLTLKDDSINPEVRNFYRFDLSDRVSYNCLGLSKGVSPYQWWKIWKYINKCNPEVVHYHGGPMPYWMMVPMWLSSPNIRFFQTIHNDIKKGYNTWKYRMLVKTMGNRKRVKFVALSQTNYETLMQEYPHVNATCIENGRSPMIPTSNYSSTRKEIDSYKYDNDSLIFLHVARCNPQKNQLRLINAFNILSEKRNVELLIIGNGFESPLGESILTRAGKHIHYIGTRKNISDYQLCADAFCLSSDFEGMPITILEALLSGTPVCSTPVCGAVDAIHDGENGVLARDFSNEAYLEALERMYDNIEKYRAIAISQKDSSPYAIKVCAQKYLQFFQL